MRILHCVYTPRYSGAEILTRDLSLIHSSAGHAVGIVALNPTEQSFSQEIARMREAGIAWFVPSTPLSRLRRLMHIRGAAEQFQPEFLIAHSVLPSFYARIAFLFDRSPTIVSVLHDASRNDYSRRSFRQLERILRSRAAAIVAVSPEALSNYSALVGSHKRMIRISNGIDLKRISTASEKRNAIRREMGIERGRIVWLQVGRFSPVKQQHLTVKALARVLHGNVQADVKLLLAGIEEDIQYLDEVKQLATRLGISQRIEFIGPRADIPELLAAADLYVMPSRAEAQTIAFLEALVSGVPIVASDIEPFQFASDFLAVALIDPADIESFAQAAASLSCAPRVFRDLEAYSIIRTADAYLSVLQSLE